MAPDMTTASPSAAQTPLPPLSAQVPEAALPTTTPASRALDAKDTFVPVTPASPTTSAAIVPQPTPHHVPTSTAAWLRRPGAIFAGSVCTGVVARAGWHLAVKTLPAVLGPYALGVLPFVAIDAGFTLYYALSPGHGLSQDATSPRHAAVVGAMLCAAMSATLSYSGYVAPAFGAPVAMAAVVLGLCLGAAVCLVLQQSAELRRVTRCLDTERQARAQHEAAAATSTPPPSPSPSPSRTPAPAPKTTTASASTGSAPSPPAALPQAQPAQPVPQSQTSQALLPTGASKEPNAPVALPVALPRASVLTRQSLQAWCTAPRMLVHERAVRQKVAAHILAAASEVDDAAAPRGLVIRGDLDLRATARLSALPEGLRVEGALRLSGCRNLRALPEHLYVKGDLDVSSCSALTDMPEAFTVEKTLDVSECMSLAVIPKGHLQRIRGPISIAPGVTASTLPFDLHAWRTHRNNPPFTRGNLLRTGLAAARQSIWHAALCIGG